MFELVLFACLLKDPHHCESFRLPFSYEMQAPQCVWQSQMKAAQWVASIRTGSSASSACEMPRA